MREGHKSLRVTFGIALIVWGVWRVLKGKRGHKPGFWSLSWVSYSGPASRQETSVGPLAHSPQQLALSGALELRAQHQTSYPYRFERPLLQRSFGILFGKHCHRLVWGEAMRSPSDMPDGPAAPQSNRPHGARCCA